MTSHVLRGATSPTTTRPCARKHDKLTLTVADQMTVDYCLASKDRFTRISDWDARPLQYRPQRRRWFASASKTRWVITTALYISTLVTASVLLSMAIQSEGLSGGFGFDLRSPTVEFGHSLPVVNLILLVNSPQILLSFLYFAYNGLYTCMLLTLEFASFAHNRKSLRVTNPRACQRSTYRLQLPYRYGIPLLIMSTILHWLVSQSFFVVNLEKYTSNGDFNGVSRSCGYSSSALLAAIVVGSLVLCVGLANGCRTYEPGIPLVGSCSAAISAACHPPPGDDRPSEKKIQWGVCGQLRKAGRGEPQKAEMGHCTLTSFRTQKPVEGVRYAGLTKLAAEELDGVGQLSCHKDVDSHTAHTF